MSQNGNGHHNLDSEIAQLAARRQELWASGHSDPHEVDRIGRKLEALYEQRRALGTQARHGSRKEIFHRARIEYELEKLMAEPA